MRRRSPKITIGFIIVFIVALVLSVMAVNFLPIPGDYKRLALFLLIPAISAAGVFILSITKKR